MPPLFAAEVVEGVPNWAVIAGFIVTAILAPFFRDVIVANWLRLRRQRMQEKEQDATLTAEERKWGRKDKSEEERRFDRLQDKINARVEANEARCQEELEAMRRQLHSMYLHFAVRETLVGRWMGRVAGWMDLAAGRVKDAGLPPLPDPPQPPEMPPLPSPSTEDQS